MPESPNRRVVFTLASILIFACATAQPTPNATQIAKNVATSVALTVSALPQPPTATDTPPPTPIMTFLPPPPTLIPTLAPPTFNPTSSKPEYACEVIDQQPYDDMAFRPNDNFDVRWTILNTGTQKWEHGTYLQYQNGPQMTDVTRADLPRLKPGERYEVILDAAAPAEQERQVMVWAALGPDKNGALHWMCYPYVRIVVGK